MERDLEHLGSEGGDGSSRDTNNERSEEVGVRIWNGSDETVNKETESRVSELRNGLGTNDGTDEVSRQNNRAYVQIHSFDGKNERMEETLLKVDRHLEAEKFNASHYKSLLSEFDDFVANENMSTGTSWATNYGFEVGDLVWGKVKSHPWWPGHIFNESFASSSVRRTRRPGHVLVAFFGDSSYGWFDPAELIPFESNFAEKSQQLASRNFVKAVEEAADEASRRSGLGLACKCRNPYNFRPTTVQGYFAVDVLDYEPGGVYSVNQISQARDSFQPMDTLSFIKQLALAPGYSELTGIDFVKNRATVFSLRKALFEEFDETYAQAFGVQPSRPSFNLPDQPVKPPPRAPLSGPLVIAEALGSGKSSKKSIKVKENLKKDRYLFKRRDEPSDLRTDQLNQGQISLSSPPAYVEGSLTGDYVLQKRAQPSQISVKHEQAGFSSRDGADISRDNSVSEALTVDHASAYSNFSTQSASFEAKLSVDEEKGVVDEVKKERVVLDMNMGPPMGGPVEMPGNGEGVAMVSNSHEESGKLFRLTEGHQHSSANMECDQGAEQIRDGCSDSHPSSIGEKQSGEVGTDVGVKKETVPKRFFGDFISENSGLEEKKKKKKKDLGSELNSDHPQKKKSFSPGMVGAAVGNMAGKFSQLNSSPREDVRVNLLKKDVGSNYLSNSMGTFPTAGIGNKVLELPQLLSDLQAIALDPFYGAERNLPAIIRQCFLRFRSLVYQKSLVFSPPPDSEAVEVRTMRPPSSTGASDGLTNDNVKDMTPSKPVKAVRPEDPTKSGRKRLISDRQEEMAAKRVKKIDQMKALTVKKATQGQRLVEAPKAEGKEQGSLVAPVRSVKPLPVRKMESTAKAAVEPTMLVMKFPPCTSLPSVAKLKAKFGRFRSLDQSAIRVFWKSSTCRVVFRHKADAQAALKYVKGNNSLFGNVEVTSYLRTMEAPAQEGPESSKPRAEDTQIDPLRVREPTVEQRLATSQPIPQSIVQLKSCLKKPTPEDSGQVVGSNGNRGTVRVKFMLGGEESNRGDQLNRNNFNNNNNNNNPSFADGAAPSSVAMDFNRNNFQKVIPPSPSPVLHPLPPQFAKPPLNNLHHHHHHHHHHQTSEVSIAPRNSQNVVVNPQISQSPQAMPSADISQQMLNLLTRCNDVVSNVSGMLGYVPYHPL